MVIEARNRLGVPSYEREAFTSIDYVPTCSVVCGASFIYNITEMNHNALTKQLVKEYRSRAASLSPITCCDVLERDGWHGYVKFGALKWPMLSFVIA